MGSDRARVSYDVWRQWRLVTRQQGRVTLEADENEADAIAAEELRRETHEVVGDCGTPDNGYAIDFSGAKPEFPYDVTVGKGTMYVGGVRVSALDNITYSAQSDWLDFSKDPAWVDPSTSASDNKMKNELIYLLLKEQEVGAVEDTALRDIALGGPDTCQRSRILQRIVRFATDANDCATAMQELATTLHQNFGLTLVDGGTRLKSASTLQVVFPQQNNQDGLCAPEAVGGYLKPDNQLLRIKVDSAAQDGGKFIWGYDDASFMYRVTAQGNKGVTVLKLLSQPIDEFHRPLNGQIVEVLRSTAHLSSGAEDGLPETSTDDYVASADGFVTPLASDYDPGTRTITLTSAIPDEYASDPNPLFVRVWEAELAFQQGVPADLAGTGIQVIIANIEKGPVHPGDYWMVAARPGAGTTVYPERLLKQGQPPDGPRTWICPISVVTWDNQVLTLVQDCRNPFEDLVDLTKRLPQPQPQWPVIREVNWQNDRVLTVDLFNKGLAVSISTAIVPSTISEQTFQVMLDLPGIYQPRDSTPTAQDMLRIPNFVRGKVGGGGGTYRFIPQPSVSAAELRTWLTLQNALESRANFPPSPGIRCRVTLKGDTILDGGGNALDGEAFGHVQEAAGATHTALRFPTGNGVQGGDFNSWFFLALPQGPKVAKIVPAKAAVFPPNKVPQNIQVTFSEAVQNVDSQTFRLEDAFGRPVLGKVTTGGSGTQATFLPDRLAPPPAATNAQPETFYIRLIGSSIVDANGVGLEGDDGVGTTWSSWFSVLPLTGVISDPPNGAVYVYPNIPTVIVLRFTAPADLTQVSQKNLTVTVNGVNLAGSIKPSADGLTLTFAPNWQPLRRGAQTRRAAGGAGRAGAAGAVGAGPVVARVQIRLAGVMDRNGCPIDGAGDGKLSDFVSTFDVTWG